MLGLTASLMVYIPQSYAQTVCGERAKIAAYLSSNYSETLESMGLSESGSVIEVYRSPKGSFTILSTNPSGLTCLIVAGEAWEKLPIIPVTNGHES